MASAKRRWGWLVAAVLLLAAGAWLMFSGDPPLPNDPDRVNLPTHATREETKRANERKTLVLLPPLSDAGVPLAAAPPPLDPVLALMPSTVKRGAMVAEFNAIVNSDIGGLMLDCLFQGDQRMLGDLRDAGLDPTTAVDRVAFIDDTMVVTGNFKSGAWKAFLPGTPLEKDYGPRGKIFEWPEPDGGTTSMATWGDSMMLAGESTESLKASMDRLESKAPREPGVLGDDQAYGEMYGVITPSTIADVIGQQDQQLGETFRSAATKVRLHADVSHDVGMVADIEGDDSSKTEELRRALGGALSLARVQAQAKGKPDQAELLDAARVRAAGNGTFRLEAGLPYEFMKKVFSDCVERKKRVPDAGSP